MAFQDVDLGDPIEVKVVNPTEAALALEVVRLAEARAKLKELGERPDPVQVEEARKSILLIESSLKDQLEELFTGQCPPGEDLQQWRFSQVQFFFITIRLSTTCSVIQRSFSIAILDNCGV